jgi:hypothetical protein
MVGKILNGKVSPVFRNDWRDFESIVGAGDYP